MVSESPGEPVEAGERVRALATAELARLYRLARKLAGDEAEDAVQDCLLRAYRSFSQLERADA